MTVRDVDNYVVVAGTRPEIIKVAPIIREILRTKKRLFFVHTGQHYDFSLSENMINDLELPEPNLSFRLRSHSPASQIAEIMKNLEYILNKKRNLNLVIVQGDTNSVLAAALAAVKSRSPLAHVEAGLRSFDWRMPEEHNRRMVDHISNYLFAPTRNSRQNLLRENVFGHVYVTGNTVIDAVNQHLPIAEKKASQSKVIPFSEYSIATFHRSENVDNRKVLSNIVEGLIMSEVPIVIPLHPRTKKMLKHFNFYDKLSKNKNIYLMHPQGYLDFLLLMKHSKLLITDSGGIQEEATAPAICKKVIVLRNSTERQEAIKTRFAKLVRLKASAIAEEILSEWSNKQRQCSRSPFGDGTSSKQIINILNKIK